MTRRRLLANLLLFVVLPSSAHPGAQARQRAFYASALDQNGAPVAALGPADVIVREDKVTREVLSVTPATEPMHILLLVDNSKAAEPYIRDYREALTAFINTVAADPSGVRHQIGIITVADRPTINTESTPDLGTAVRGAQRLFALPDSGSYLLDGIIETSRGIVKREMSRPVIVAVSTQGPEMSDRQYQTVLEPLRNSGAAFHVVTVGRPTGAEQDRAIVVDVGTRDLGGRNEMVFTGNGLIPQLKQLAAELTHQHVVTYARPDSLIPPRQVTIASARPGLTVRGVLARTKERP